MLEVVEAVGKLDGERLKRAQEWFEGQKGQRKKFLMLRLPNPRDRAGQPEHLNQAGGPSSTPTLFASHEALLLPQGTPQQSVFLIIFTRSNRWARRLVYRESKI